MICYQSEVSTAYAVHVDVNAEKMLFTGTGYGRAEKGEVGVHVTSGDACIEGFHPAFLAFTLITGQADISRCVGVDNPFRLNKGAYSATRTLKLDNDLGLLQATYCFGAMRKSHREASFEITGYLRAPTIKAIAPAFEVWVPHGKNRLRGHFSMIWITEDGTHIKGEVDTMYHIEGVNLENPLYRRIEFSIDAGEKHLKQDERIILFGENTTLALAA